VGFRALKERPVDTLRLLGAVTAGTLLLWLSWPAFAPILVAWEGDYAHGYLIVPLAAWLMVRELRHGAPAFSLPSWTGFAVLLALVLIVIVARAATLQDVFLLVLPALWLAAIWALFGSTTARRSTLPMICLYLAIPLWNHLMPALQRLTILVVSAWIDLAGLPAFIEGDLIHVPSGTFEVQQGCAGLRYALTAIALALVNGQLARGRWMSTLGLAAFALLLAFLGNWLRVFITVIVGFSSEGLLSTFVRDHHTAFGWSMFVLCMVPFFYVIRRQEGGEPPSPAREAIEGPPAGGARRIAVTGAVCTVMVLAAAFLYRIDRVGETSTAARVSAAPVREVAGWAQAGEWDDARRPFFPGADSETASWYAGGTHMVGVYVAWFPRQRQGYEVVSVDHRPGGSGAVVARRPSSIVNDAGDSMPVEEIEVSDGESQRRLVWVVLIVAGEAASSRLDAKLLQIRGLIRGRGDAQAVVLTAACGESCDAARAALSRYATAVFPAGGL
jgi:EpsI family protein